MTILSKGCKAYYQKDVSHRELEFREFYDSMLWFT